jgi:hypothetical protein
MEMSRGREPLAYRGPMARSTGWFPADRVVVALVVAFWVLLFVVGATNDGYSQTRDYISVAAAQGTSAGVLGVTAIVALGLAYLITARIVRPLSGIVAALLAVAGVAFVCVGIARIECPNGAAGCFRPAPATIDREERVHDRAAKLAGAATVAAAFVGTLALAAHRRPGQAALTATAGIVSAGAGLIVPAGHPGAVQRLAVLIWSIGIAAVAWAAHPRHERQKARFEG